MLCATCADALVAAASVDSTDSITAPERCGVCAEATATAVAELDATAALAQVAAENR